MTAKSNPLTKSDPLRIPRLCENEVRFYREQGYLIIPGLLGDDAAASLRQEVLTVMAHSESPEGKLRQSLEYLAGSGLDRLINSPPLRGLASQLMEGPSTLYMPFTAVKSPGGGQFHFHQDNQYTRFDGPGINLWFGLNEMSPENGCLMVIPRSHLQGTLLSVDSGDGDHHRKVDYEPADFFPIRMRPGDCVAFSRLTVHGSGANSSSDPRVAYAVQFHRDDVKALREGGEWRLLTDSPRWNPRPVVAFSTGPREESLDGH